jgi:hypothetical protein
VFYRRALQFTEGSTIKTIWQVFIIPAHLFSMFCIFFMLYKAAKTIKTAELQKKVTSLILRENFFFYGFLLLEFGFYSQKLSNL